MKLRKASVVVSMMLLTTLLPAAAMAAFNTESLVITSPQNGAAFATHDWVIVNWYANCFGIPPGGPNSSDPMHYQIEFDGSQWTYAYYSDIHYDNPNQTQGVGDFTMTGHYAYRVPGDGFSRHPHALLQVASGSTTCPTCYARLTSVTISIKTSYDPDPIPTEKSGRGRATANITTWGRVKALYTAP